MKRNFIALRLKNILSLKTPISKFFLAKHFLYFPEKTHPETFLTFWEIKLSGPKVRRFAIFSQKRFSYISGDGTF